ncbi:MAG TPA: 2-dehydropantoate 2-reductase [candidate division Zixibacteria bacterium]|nr:2-dehydropantoate 2-reductase [candidate division Zixibacteria bacterium]
MKNLPRKTKIAVMGAGAIGSVIGGMLARNGHRVTLIGRKPHIDEIGKNGLHISGIWGDYTIREINAVIEPPREYQDIVFLTVKSFDTARAAVEAVPMVGQNTVVVSIQNGLGNIETLVKTFGKEKIIGGMAIFGVVLPEPGNVRVTVIASETLVGEPDGTLTSRVKDIADMLDVAGIPAKASDDIMRDIWHKALYNIALNPLSAIFGVSYGEIADNPHTRWLAKQMNMEAFRVAKATGQSLGIDTADEYLEILWNQKLPPTRDHKSSMLQDILRGKRTEIDFINGAVVRLGAEHGIETPYNRAVVSLVKAKESLGHR